MKQEIVIAVDIGTTSLKIAAINKSGQFIEFYSYKYKTNIISRNQTQSWHELWDNFLNIVRKIIINNFEEYQIKYISISSAIHSFMLLDKNYSPITDIILWSNCQYDLDIDYDKDIFHTTTGMLYDSVLTIFKLNYLRKNNHRIWRKVHKVVSIKEYIIYLLIDKFVIDYASAGGTGLFNIESLSWDVQLLDKIGAKREWFGEIVSPIEKYRVYNYLNDLLPELQIIVGSADGVLACLGAELPSQNTITLTLGTSTGCRYNSFEKIDLRKFSNHYMMYFNDNMWVVGYTSSNGTNNLKHFLITNNISSEEIKIIREKENFANSFESQGFYFPYLYKERFYNHYSHATFYPENYPLQNSLSDVYKSIVLGLIFNSKEIIDRVKTVNHEKVIVGGGLFGYKPYLSLLSCLLDLEVYYLEKPELSLLGAAKLAMLLEDIVKMKTRVGWMSQPLIKAKKANNVQFGKIEYHKWLNCRDKIYS